MTRHTCCDHTTSYFHHPGTNPIIPTSAETHLTPFPSHNIMAYDKLKFRKQVHFVKAFIIRAQKAHTSLSAFLRQWLKTLAFGQRSHKSQWTIDFFFLIFESLSYVNIWFDKQPSGKDSDKVTERLWYTNQGNLTGFRDTDNLSWAVGFDLFVPILMKWHVLSWEIKLLFLPHCSSETF